MASEKDKLVALLDKKVFDPILKKSERSYSENDRKKLKNLKKSTESEKKRFHERYKTAESVKKNYLSDLSSQTGKRKDKEAQQLHLPKMPDIEQEFKELCDKLGI